MKNIVLNKGLEMPLLGFGVYQIADLDECKKSVFFDHLDPEIVKWIGSR